MTQMRTVTKFPAIVEGSSAGGVYIRTRGKFRHDVVDWFTDVGVNSFRLATAWLNNSVDGGTPVHVPHVFHSLARQKLATRLCAIHNMDEVFFSNDGTEAVEAAIKLVRKYSGQTQRLMQGRWNEKDVHRDTIYAEDSAFHGRTYGAMSATFTHRVSPYHHEGFGPELPGFKPFMDFTDIDFEKALGVIVSPIFGNNDVIPPDVEELKWLREQCTKYDVVLVFDEVQSGHGRCGAWSAAQLYGVEPDIICFAKGIAAGMPLGATLAKKPFCGFTLGSHFNTFGGNEISCRMAHKVLDWLSEKKNMKSIEVKGQILRDKIVDLGCTRYGGALGPIRQIGLMIAVDTPGVDSTEIGKAAMKNGLLCGSFRSNKLKIFPHLDCTMDQLKEGVKRFTETIDGMVK